MPYHQKPDSQDHAPHCWQRHHHLCWAHHSQGGEDPPQEPRCHHRHLHIPHHHHEHHGRRLRAVTLMQSPRFNPLIICRCTAVASSGTFHAARPTPACLLSNAFYTSFAAAVTPFQQHLFCFFLTATCCTLAGCSKASHEDTMRSTDLWSRQHLLFHPPLPRWALKSAFARDPWPHSKPWTVSSLEQSRRPTHMWATTQASILFNWASKQVSWNTTCNQNRHSRRQRGSNAKPTQYATIC